MSEEKIPFDPETQSLYCSWDGLKLEQSGHMFSEFLLCPRHGEFTIAPVVMKEPLKILGPEPSFNMIDNPSPDAGKWFIRADETLAGEISNIQAIDARHKDGQPYDPRESRVL